MKKLDTTRSKHKSISSSTTENPYVFLARIIEPPFEISNSYRTTGKPCDFPYPPRQLLTPLLNHLPSFVEPPPSRTGSGFA